MPPEGDPTPWIISLRPPKARVNAWEPNGFFVEEERSARGDVVRSAGVLLTNKECPWHCLMCDLWKHTLAQTVPSGAIPAQIAYALARLGIQAEQVKLYNSGSFFDPGAIPPADYPAIARAVSFARQVIVEAHPRLIGEKALRFRDLLDGSLELALGLETVHPQVLPRLNKRFTLEQFAASCAFLRKAGIQVRAFVLVQPPYMKEEAAIEWSVESARFAFASGVEVVSLIPTRPGNGALDALIKSGEFIPPRLSALESSLERCLALKSGRVFADTWDLQQFSFCDICFQQRRQRLHSMNLRQMVLPRVSCPNCQGA